jgi:hypothetical protein
MKRLLLSATVVVALVCPGSAWADSGSITNVFGSGDDVWATYTSVSTTCSPSGYCGWFPYGVQSPASAPCTPHTEGDGRLTYVGEGGTDTGPYSETATDNFFPSWSPVKICLYTWRPDSMSGPGIDTLVAEYVHGAAAATPVAPTPAPAPEPASEPDAVPAMGVSEAKDYLSGLLRKKFGKRFKRRSGRFSRSCYRLSAEKVRCRVSWKYKAYRYSGTVDEWNDPSNPSEKFLYRIHIKRKRIGATASGLSSVEARFRAAVQEASR